MGRRTLGEVCDGLRDSRGGPRWVGGPLGNYGQIERPSGKPGTGWGNLEEVRDGSWDTPGRLGRVGEPLERYGTGQGTLGQVRYG